jgi:hypothetical protein
VQVGVQAGWRASPGWRQGHCMALEEVLGRQGPCIRSAGGPHRCAWMVRDVALA